MVAKKSQSRSRSKPEPKKPVLQNLAARPTNFDDTIDEQMVDASGVFRVTSAIKQAQTGHDEEQGMRFANESLVIRAQRDGFREDGTTIDEVVEETTVEDEATLAVKRQRLATLAARNEARTRRR